MVGSNLTLVGYCYRVAPLLRLQVPVETIAAIFKPTPTETETENEPKKQKGVG